MFRFLNGFSYFLKGNKGREKMYNALILIGSLIALIGGILLMDPEPDQSTKSIFKK